MSREVVESPFVHMPKKKQASAYLSEVYKMSEVCKITRTIQNRFDMGGRYVHRPDKMRGWREGDDHHGRRRSDMLFFRRENIHNRPEISEHVHTRVPERCVKHTKGNKGHEAS